MSEQIQDHYLLPEPNIEGRLPEPYPTRGGYQRDVLGVEALHMVALPEQTPDDESELRESIVAAKELFDTAFRWSEHISTEFFSRVSGSEDELSDELQEKLLDLYIQSRSSFVQEENQTESKLIIDAFTRPQKTTPPLNTREIQAVLVTLYPDRETVAQEHYVTRRLLTILEKISHQQE